MRGTGDIAAQFLCRDVEGARAARGASATVGYQGGAVGWYAPYSFDTMSVSHDTVLSLVMAGQKTGASFCVSNPNSTGRIGQLVLSGPSSISGNDLRAAA